MKVLSLVVKQIKDLTPGPKYGAGSAGEELDS